jgi:hypothetical protein
MDYVSEHYNNIAMACIEISGGIHNEIEKIKHMNQGLNSYDKFIRRNLRILRKDAQLLFHNTHENGSNYCPLPSIFGAGVIHF